MEEVNECMKGKLVSLRRYYPDQVLGYNLSPSKEGHPQPVLKGSHDV